MNTRRPLAAGSSAAVDLSIARTPAGWIALLLLCAHVLATLGSIEPRTSLLGNYGVGQGLLTVAIGVAYFWLAASWVRTEAELTSLRVWSMAGLTPAATRRRAWSRSEAAIALSACRARTVSSALSTRR